MKNTQNFKRLDRLGYLIFEECDRTLDLGFKNEVNEILDNIQQKIDIESICKLLVAASFNHNLEN